VLKNTPTLSSRSSPSLSVGLNVFLFVLFGWALLSVATNEDAWRTAFTSLMRLNRYCQLVPPVRGADDVTTLVTAWCYNSESGRRREDESRVKDVGVLAVVGTAMSKRFYDTEVL